MRWTGVWWVLAPVRLRPAIGRHRYFSCHLFVTFCVDFFSHEKKKTRCPVAVRVAHFRNLLRNFISALVIFRHSDSWRRLGQFTEADLCASLQDVTWSRCAESSIQSCLRWITRFWNSMYCVSTCATYWWEWDLRLMYLRRDGKIPPFHRAICSHYIHEIERKVCFPSVSNVCYLLLNGVCVCVHSSGSKAQVSTLILIKMVLWTVYFFEKRWQPFCRKHAQSLFWAACFPNILNSVGSISELLSI